MNDDIETGIGHAKELLSQERDKQRELIVRGRFIITSIGVLSGLVGIIIAITLKFVGPEIATQPVAELLYVALTFAALVAVGIAVFFGASAIVSFLTHMEEDHGTGAAKPRFDDALTQWSSTQPRADTVSMRSLMVALTYEPYIYKAHSKICEDYWRYMLAPGNEKWVTSDSLRLRYRVASGRHSFREMIKSSSDHCLAAIRSARDKVVIDFLRTADGTATEPETSRRAELADDIEREWEGLNEQLEHLRQRIHTFRPSPNGTHADRPMRLPSSAELSYLIHTASLCIISEERETAGPGEEPCDAFKDFFAAYVDWQFFTLYKAPRRQNSKSDDRRDRERTIRRYNGDERELEPHFTGSWVKLAQRIIAKNCQLLWGAMSRALMKVIPSVAPRSGEFIAHGSKRYLWFSGFFGKTWSRPRLYGSPSARWGRDEKAAERTIKALEKLTTLVTAANALLNDDTAGKAGKTRGDDRIFACCFPRVLAVSQLYYLQVKERVLDDIIQVTDKEGVVDLTSSTPANGSQDDEGNGKGEVKRTQLLLRSFASTYFTAQQLRSANWNLWWRVKVVEMRFNLAIKWILLSLAIAVAGFGVIAITDTLERWAISQSDEAEAATPDTSDESERPADPSQPDDDGPPQALPEAPGSVQPIDRAGVRDGQ